MPLHNIQYLQRSQIDTLKWDRCIESASNGLIYGHSFCLDHLAPEWDALVLNDYETVMPLTTGKKYGIRYIFQPFFIPALGIIGPAVDTDRVDAFINSIPKHFKLIDIDLHESNITTKFDHYCTKRVNMLLGLNREYPLIQQQYHRLANRMIRRAQEQGLQLDTNADISNSIAFYKEHYGAVLKIEDAVYDRITRMFSEATENKKALSLSVKKEGQLVGVYLLLYDQKHVYSVLGGSSAAGKKCGAFYLLTDYAIQHFANTSRVFRFEGSDLPGIADFNSQFSPTLVHYDHLKVNKLPAPIRWLK